jgi:hypothetical protein
MSGSNPPAPTDPSQEKPLESPPVKQPQVGSTSGAQRFSRTRAGRRIAYAVLVLVALAASYIAGALLFRATGHRKGYAAGYASVGYFEGAAIADSMKADASDTVFGLAGLMPDSGQHGLWHVARFGLTPAKALCKYGNQRELDTMRVPTFSAHVLAPVGRSYRSGSGGRIYHVDR